MKYINIIIEVTALTMLLLCASCANKKVIITGPAGTEIYSPAGELVATIGTSETVSHKINDGDSYILKARIPNSDVIVPFALDYKKGHRVRNAIFMATGLGMYLPQAWFGFADELSFPGEFNMSFDKRIYLPRQLNVPSPSFNRSIQSNDVTPIPQETTKTLKSNRASSSIKTLGNIADKVKGDYKCSGSLLQGQEIIESYPEITVRISKISNNMVGVNVIENNDIKFFAKDEKYDISKSKSGGYELIHTSIPSALIIITKSGEITYFHPAVEIDGEKFQLKLKSRK